MDWNERQLCDDGGCTGVIGRDGRCGVCGRAAQFWGDERRRGMVAEPVEGADTAEAAGEPAARRGAARDDDSERRLCPDGSCTGLIGADGRCKVCGALDEAAPVRAAAADDGGDAGDGGEGDDGEDDDDEAAGDGGAGDEDGDGAGDAAVASGGDERRLCPDGGCTGLIGDGGACRVCGRVEEI